MPGVVVVNPGVRNGLNSWTTISSASINATMVYPGPCHLDLLSGFNVNAAARYVKIYDTAVTSTSGFAGVQPTVSFGLPGNTAGAGSNLPMSPAIPSGGLQLSQGLAFCITANMALTDQSAVGAGDVLLTLGYK